MPGENLQKLNKEELRELRQIVRKVYAEEQGASKEAIAYFWTDEECDKLIDSLLPDTVEKLKEMKESRGFLSKKKFFLPSKVVGLNGKAIMREDTD